VPLLIEPGSDELRAGDLEGAPIEAYRSRRNQHTSNDRLPAAKASKTPRRYANALRRLLARTETVTLVVVHELSPRYILAAAQPARRPFPAPPFPTQFREYSSGRLPTVSAPDGHGMILIERCVAYVKDATYRVVYAGLGP
jgi:hypothetical protein